MKSKIGIFLSLILFSLQQTIAFSLPKSIHENDFLEFLAGVQFATALPNSTLPTNGFFGGEEEIVQSAIFRALELYNISAYTDRATSDPCDVVRISYSYRLTGVLYKRTISDLVLIFTACDGKEWKKLFTEGIFLWGTWGTHNGRIKIVRNRIRAKLNLKQIPPYSPKYKRALTGIGPSKVWNEIAVRSYLENNSIESVEGIYEVASSNDSNYRLALIKEEGVYKLIYLTGAKIIGYWVEGDIKALLIPTATARFFKAEYYMLDKSINNGVYIEMEEGLMRVNFPKLPDTIYLKTLPVNSSSKR